MTMKPARLLRPRVALFSRAFLAGSFVLLAGCAVDRPVADRPATAAQTARIEAAAVGVLLEGAYAIGPAGARTVFIEFTDFQCPHCRRFHEGVFRELRRRYVDTGQARYLVRTFPLPMHRHAFDAAIAAQCAANQERYWEMSDRLFAAQDRLNPTLYRELAQQAGLAMPEFDACWNSIAARRAVNYSVAAGARFGIDTTPTLIVGRMDRGVFEISDVFAGVPDIEQVELAIELLPP
jgi:protein-disulfide isomerase